MTSFPSVDNGCMSLRVTPQRFALFVEEETCRCERAHFCERSNPHMVWARLLRKESSQRHASFLVELEAGMVFTRLPGSQQSPAGKDKAASQTKRVSQTLAATHLPKKPSPSLALVLAGGLGTRLRPVLADRPKSLAPAAGRPFLHYILDYLKGQGVRRVILCVGYLASQVQDFARHGQDWGLEIGYSVELAALGTGGALRQASAGLNEPFFALNGDTLFRVDLPALWEQQARLGCLATAALLRVPAGSAETDVSVRGCVRLAEDGHILSFDEKPAGTPHAQTPRRGVSTSPVLVNGGVYILAPQALAEIPLGQAASIERDVFPHLAARRQLAGLEQSAYFADIGTPESLAAFERDVLDGTWNLKPDPLSADGADGHG